MRKKKLLCIILSIFMVINLLPVGVTAAGTIEVSTETELINALDRAQNGDVITLASAITVNQQLVINADITLDLGGYTLTNTYVNVDGTGIYRFTLITNKNVKIQNGTYETTAEESTNGVETRGIVASEGNLTIGGGVTVKCNGIAVATYSEGGTLTINGSSISGTYAVGSFANNSTVIIEKSTLKGSVCGLYHNGSYYGLVMEVEDSTIIGDSTGVYISGSKTTTSKNNDTNQQASFSNCIISGKTGIEVKYTDLTLEDCTVTATTSTTSYVQDNNGSTTAGFAVVSTDNTTGNATPSPSGTIIIDGGTYTGAVSLSSVTTVGDEADYFISAGTFDTDISEYVVAGFAQNDNGEVVEATVDNAVAQIGSTYYYSLKEALEAATTMETVTLLQDITLNKSLVVNINNNCYPTLDLNGHTITFAYDSTGKFNGAELNANTVGFELASGYLSIEDSVGGGGIVAENDCIIPIGATGTSGFHSLNIYGGSYTTNSPTTPVVYASGIANIYIYDGTFTNSDTSGTVLAVNGTEASISVRGGTYVGEDPTAYVDTSFYTVVVVSAGVYRVGSVYDFEVATTTNGTITTDPSIGYTFADEPVTIYTTPDAGYEVESVIISSDELNESFAATEITKNEEYQFNVLASSDVIITVTFRLASTPTTTYNVTVDPKTGGTAYASVQTANEGDIVTITTIPDSGYTVGSITCPGVNITTVVENSTYTFTMPAADVTVTVTFTAQSQSSGKGEIGGIIYVNEEYHGILLTQNGRTHILSVAHTVDENGYCTVCKAYIGLEEEEESVEITEEVVEIEDPVEAGETDSE
ncbi:MAG: hypothetical protein LUC38_08160 [Oscillospiraceae bacterium]|nr:hypothetical protein [Oscillospiraceae bacterium]